MFSLLLIGNNDVSLLTKLLLNCLNSVTTVHVACLGIRTVQDNATSYVRI